MSLDYFNALFLIFLGVSLWALRCAYAHKVGVLRANGAAPSPWLWG
ncbi:MAG: hypothetical protein NZ455_02955 [Bacteroidia bacterium]|nr:hypothetical protein [Bacteroidia bacterium]